MYKQTKSAGPSVGTAMENYVSVIFALSTNELINFSSPGDVILCDGRRDLAKSHHSTSIK